MTNAKAPASRLEFRYSGFVILSSFGLRHFDARPEGLEPSTYGLEIRCSIRLSYGRRMSTDIYPVSPRMKPAERSMPEVAKVKHSTGVTTLRFALVARSAPDWDLCC
jgi:hypothetical protein